MKSAVGFVALLVLAGCSNSPPQSAPGFTPTSPSPAASPVATLPVPTRPAARSTTKPTTKPSSKVFTKGRIHTCSAPKGHVLTTVPAVVSRNVALTFDDGPSPKWTPQVLDVLKANRVHATFFVVGKYARAHPSLVRRAVAEGHTIGNHSYSHPKMTPLGRRRQAAQMDAATKYISAAADGYKPCFFRPPYGAYDATTVRLARDRAMSTVFWSHDTRDWTTPRHPSSSFQRRIVQKAVAPAFHHPNVLLHDGPPNALRTNTARSVQRIITYYKDRGYRFTNPAGR